jgi:hypothetical protein
VFQANRVIDKENWISRLRQIRIIILRFTAPHNPRDAVMVDGLIICQIQQGHISAVILVSRDTACL